MIPALSPTLKQSFRIDPILGAAIVTLSIFVLGYALTIFFSNQVLDKTEVPVPTDYRQILRALAKINSFSPQDASPKGLERTIRLANLLVNSEKPPNRLSYLKEDLADAHRLLLKYAYKYPDLDDDLKMELAIARLTIFNRLQFFSVFSGEKLHSEDVAIYVKNNFHTLREKDLLIAARRELITSRILEELPIADLMQMPELKFGTPAYDERLHWAFAKCARQDLAEEGEREMKTALDSLQGATSLLAYLSAVDLLFPIASIEFFSQKRSLCDGTILRYFRIIGGSNAGNP